MKREKLSRLVFPPDSLNQRIRIAGKKRTSAFARSRPTPPADCRFHLAEKSFGESAVDRNDVTAGATRLWPGQKQNSTSAIRGLDRLMRQCSLCIKARKQRPQFVIRLLIAERNSIFLERRQHSIAREHSRALHYRRGT